MGSRYELEVTIISGKDLKNVHWRHGNLKAYAVVWIDPANKRTTRVDEDGHTTPFWDDKLVIPFDSPIEDTTLHVDIVHATAAEGTKPLIGSAKLHLRDVFDAVGFGSHADRKLDLKRPSGRPQGRVELKVCVREPRYRAPDPYYPQPYGVRPGETRDYQAPPYGSPYGAPPPAYGAPTYGSSYGAPAPAYAAPPAGYPASYGAPPQNPVYGQQGYVEEKKKSKFGGMGTGLAVGAVAGVLGGLALEEGFEHFEHKVADDVEDDEGYGNDDGDY